MNYYQELVELNQKVQNLVNEEEVDWELKYDLIFCPEVSTKVFELFRKLNLQLDYYDPDTSYEEDIRAFSYAFKEKMEELSKIEYMFERG